MPKKLYTLTLTRDQAAIVHALVTRDGSYDHIGKNTDFPLDDVFEVGDIVGDQLEEQGLALDREDD